MNDIIIIENKIHEIRGQKVMLDFDLAEMYEVETKNLNKAVKRNIERFPDDFMFQLTKKEMSAFRFQFGTSSWGGTRYFPFAFTEQGVAMLSGIFRSPGAIEVNINIMRAFVHMRQHLLTRTPKLELEELEQQINILKKIYHPIDIVTRNSLMNYSLPLSN